MPWTATFDKDADKPRVGRAVAIWNLGAPGEFRHQGRIDEESGAAGFVAEAIAARDDGVLDDSRNNTIATRLAAALNTAEGG